MGLYMLYHTVYNEIQIFNLTLIRRFSTSPHDPFSITVSSNQLYVGTEEGMKLVYQNEILNSKMETVFG